MNLAKIIYDVREALKLYSDDTDVTDRYITYLYGIKRAKYLRQDLNNFQKSTDLSITQTLCLQLEVVSANQCASALDCGVILRTKRPIPQPIELHTKSAITSVKSTNRISLPFNFVTKEKAIYSKFSPFNKSVFAFLDNDNYIYVISESNTVNLIECITITGIFEDPLELKTYSNCCSCEAVVPCFDMATTNYPLQPHYIDLIKIEIITQLAGRLNIQDDKTNNSVND
tara:strand:+ start:989 stop:1672 length:684 start_codon:yes stop_codon:yes gene_type:complete